jgi:glyoxylase I family protein
MAIKFNGIHHMTLTVTDTERSLDFYNTILGFEFLREVPPDNRKLMTAGGLLIGLRPIPASPDDQFDEDRVGLDHLSFSVPNRAELDAAVQLLDTLGVPHGDIEDLPQSKLYMLVFRDPDNIQLELTAPYGD